MAIEQTLSIIKPDAIKRHIIGKIYDRFESNQLFIKDVKMMQLTKAQAQEFYAVHREKPFYDSLSDPCTEFSSIDLAKSRRIVDGLALLGSVAPIISRCL
jgi:nucleoside diphosphate kinase